MKPFLRPLTFNDVKYWLNKKKSNTPIPFSWSLSSTKMKINQVISHSKCCEEYRNVLYVGSIYKYIVIHSIE